MLNQSRIDFHARGSAEKGLVRFVVAHLTSKRCGLVACNVRRIADDQIERTRLTIKTLQQIRLKKRDAVGNAVARYPPRNRPRMNAATTRMGARIYPRF